MTASKPLFAIAALAVLTVAAAPDPAGIDQLAAYQGRWRLEARSVDTPYSKAGTTATVIANSCLRFMQHLACGQNVDGKDAGMIVFSHDPATGGYASLIVSDDGAGHAGRLEADRGMWLFPWDERHAGATVHFRVTNRFTGPADIDYAKEYSLDGRTWLPIEIGHEHRLGD